MMNTIEESVEIAEEKTPWHRKIPERERVFVGELAQRGDWVVAYIQTESHWPIAAQKVGWRGYDFWIIPVMRDAYPAVTMKVPPGKNREQCQELIMRFISNLSWVEARGFMIVGMGGGSLPYPMVRGKHSGFSICDEFDLSYFPEPVSEKALLALALMREGRGLNHAAYAFLSFFKVLEVAIPDSQIRAKWVADNIESIADHDVQRALVELKQKGVAEIGKHLFESGRCAVAHANRHPIVDPDNPVDMRRLSSELPIVMGLAQKAIEEELGIETSRTVYRKHLYELAGFKEILGSEIVEFLTRGEMVTEQRMLEIPDINVRVRRCREYAPLNNLTIKDIAQDGKLLHMRFESKDSDVIFRFALDFGNERLQFSLFGDIGIRDTGTAGSAERVAEVQRFQYDIFGNGQLHIINAETGVLLSRKDAYIPVNMYLDQEGADADIARWEALAAQRRGRDFRYAEEMKRFSVGYDVRIQNTSAKA